MANVYLIRHAQSFANQQGFYQGQTYDTGLSELGHLQAKQLAENLKQISFDIIYTSPLLRTRETADYISGVKAITPEIIETNHGDWEGKSVENIMANWPEIWKNWHENPEKVIFPNGESFMDTYHRTINWFNKLNQDFENIGIVSHENIIQCILVSHYQQSLNDIWNYKIPNAGIKLIYA